jgi:bifunctional DNase/RNase
MANEIKLTVTGLVYNQSIVGTYGLVLSEEHGNRRFSVMIGEPEAQSIALKLNNKRSPRPLTHDLINNILLAYEAYIEKVLIYDMVNDVFYSELHINSVNDKKLVIDARTSDAVALAIRSNAPIFIKSEIIEIVGSNVDISSKKTDDEEDISEDDVAIDAEDMTPEQLDRLTDEDLNELLKMAITEEKYELAVNLRDALERKRKM